MYYFICPEDARLRLIKFGKKSPSIPTCLEELSVDPLARAKETGIPAIGKYYVNAGKYCLLFEIDESQKKVIILHVVYDSYLHKILTGRILPDPPDVGQTLMG